MCPPTRTKSIASDVRMPAILYSRGSASVSGSHEIDDPLIRMRRMILLS